MLWEDFMKLLCFLFLQWIIICFNLNVILEILMQLGRYREQEKKRTTIKSILLRKKCVYFQHFAKLIVLHLKFVSSTFTPHQSNHNKNNILTTK